MGDKKIVRSQRRFPWFPYSWRWPWDSVELFNVAQDPVEGSNLAGKFPGLTASLVRGMDVAIAEHERRFRELQGR